MTTELKQYKIYCNTESTYVQTDFVTDPPTTCPNNIAHSVNTGDVLLVSTYPVNVTVPLNNVSVEQAKMQTRGRVFDIPATVGDYITTFQSPEVDTKVMFFRFLQTADNVGDDFSLIANAFTTCGLFTANGNIGDTVLNVSPTVFTVMKPGFMVYDASNVELGFCSVVDSLAGTITISTPLAAPITAGTPVKFGIVRLYHIPIFLSAQNEFNIRAIDLMTIQKYTNLTLIYNNVNGSAKKLGLVAEFFY